jgi:DNA-directed RNA polymerase subunit RPC12/RpoP
MPDASSDGALLWFPCPRCHTPLRAADTPAGRTLRCPACRGRVTVPDRPPDPPDDEDGPEAELVATVRSGPPPRPSA